jgi:hypothetical protein
MTTVISITPERAIFAAGKFDTDNRYLRTTDTDAMTTMLAGPSLAFNFDAGTGVIGYRYEVGSFVVVAVQSGWTTAPTDVVNTPTEIAL